MVKIHWKNVIIQGNLNANTVPLIKTVFRVFLHYIFLYDQQIFIKSEDF